MHAKGPPRARAIRGGANAAQALWVVALPCGRFAWVPQNQLLLYDKSFNTVDRVPKIKRQDRV